MLTVVPLATPPMRRLLLLVLLLRTGPLLAQDADAVAASAVEVTPDDLSAVLDAVGDARVVLLGEAWHGDGGAIALRARLVEALHEQLGFDVLAFEADFFAVNRDWDRVRAGGPIRAVREDVWAFWSETRAAAPLWDYIEAQAGVGDTLHVAGFDTQPHALRSRDELAAWLREPLLALADVDASHVDDVAGLLAAALGAPGAAPEAVTDQAYELAKRLLGRLQYEAADPFTAQVAESLRRNLVNENRDLGMGDNLVWLATERFPDRKVIVWAHNNHILMDKWAFWDAPAGDASRARWSPGDVASHAYMGDAVRRAFGPAAVALATVPYEGTYSPDIGRVLRRQSADLDSTLTLAPAPPGTVEAALAARGHTLAFVDLRPLRPRLGLVPSRVLHYAFDAEPAALRLADGWDGLLFLRRTGGLNEEVGGGRPSPGVPAGE